MQRRSLLISYLYLFSFAIHGFIGWRIITPLTEYPQLQAGLWLLLLLSAGLVPAALVGMRITYPRWHQVISWSGFIAMGLISTLLVLTIIRDALVMIIWLAQALLPFKLETASIQATTSLVIWLSAFVITTIGFLNARRAPAIRQVEVPIKDLPESLQGFSIAQISDIHVGPTIGTRYLQAIVDKVNDLNADMIALTGDLVDGRVQRLHKQVEPLRTLQARYGTFFVTGNHEYYSGVHEWIEHLQSLGLKVLLNDHVVLQHNQEPLIIAGIADYTAHHFDEQHRSDPNAAIAQAPQLNATRILLAHQPRSIFDALEADFHLQLSGHTHGGQFLPWNWFVPLQQPFTAGLHWHAERWIYISRGTGYWGPPKRFGAPAEITRLVLRRA